MNINIPDQIIQQAGISAQAVLLKIAILLFQEEHITLAQAAKLAELHQIEFQLELSKRNIPIHYGEEQYKNDLQVIEQLKK